MTKNLKFSSFPNFYAISVGFSTNFADWNVEKRQQWEISVQEAFPNGSLQIFN